MIPLTADRELGPLIRRLRHRAGLTLVQLGARCHVTKGGMHKRETDCRAISAGALIETLDALGYDLVAVPRTNHTHLRRAA